MYKTIAVHARSTYWTSFPISGEEYSVVDANDLAKEVENVCNTFAKEGYEVISITPITSGSVTNGNGYIQAESVLITGKKLTKG